MHEILVNFDKLSKVFPKSPKPALDSISAQVRAGKITGLVGPDAAGKTTLIRMIAGLLKPSSGIISVFGFNTITDAKKIHQLIGYMPQKFGLYEDLTVMENLNLYAELKGLPKEQKDAIFEKLLNFTDLGKFTQRLAAALSGGMKQKLGLACALMTKPKLLLLDEPSVGVDPVSRRELWKLVRDLIDENTGVVWSTSYLDEAENCDDLIVLNEGKVLYSGLPEDLSAKVQGRTFLLKNTQNKRKVLSDLIKRPEILDAIIQGDNLRLVTVNEALDSLKSHLAKSNLKLQGVKPRLEDAFMDILGGIAVRESVLVNLTQLQGFNTENLIEAQHLTKKFAEFIATNDVSFSVKKGEIFGLLGPNGAGKSTTFKMLCGLLDPSSGKALVANMDLKQASGLARTNLGYMAQKFSLYGNLSVKQNLDFFSGIYGLAGSEQKTIVEQMIEIFSLRPYLNHNAEELPLGFKQRLALACAVMHKPAILFLDEPTSGVDPITRREFWMHINAMVENGVTVLVTTHFMDEAEYCDRIGLIYKGKLIALDNPDALKKQALSESMSDPTLEDAFIDLIHKYDLEHQ